ncbi:MAG: ABC transporter permease subunit [Oscillospiraceae bacterium]|jgi:peptide/nickel transport system permease protein|nr:ABC transporter permease subunit [Oscillospiraceae bacterium]
MSKSDNTAKKTGKSFLSMFKRLFVRDKVITNRLDEEAIRTPMKVIFLKLVRNKMAIIGFSLFMVNLLFAFIGSLIFPLNEVYIEITNRNLPPSRNFLNYPSELNDMNIVKIASGVSFSIALTDDGNLHVWGTESSVRLEGETSMIFDIPEEVQDAHIVDVVVGMRFVIVLDDEGNFYGWGEAAHNQTEIPSDIRRLMAVNRTTEIVKISAGAMWSSVLGNNGYLYLWGSFQAQNNYIVPYEAQGRIVDIASGENNMILLLDDGTVMPMGVRGTEFFENVPEELMDGSVNVVELVATNRNVIARDEQGNLYIWGSRIDGLHRFPEGFVPDKIIDIAAGLRNFIIVKENGEIIVWGAEELRQLNLPRGIEDSGVVRVFADMFQFYAVDEESNIVGAWGNRGYIFGSDENGRDIFTRLIHGGRVSLTVGVIAVVIATFIAVIIGLISGYFGGWIDHTLMRIADIFDALPFLPLVITLSFIIGDRLDQTQRLYFIMILLGVLSWTPLARLIRAQLLLEREKDFVLAAKALGIKQGGIMFKHILPNVFNFVIVSVTLSYASFILMESALSFLGFGIREPTPSWGNMLTSAQETMVIRHFWWRWIIPAIFLVAAALSINMVGDALREAMDPKSEER